jgi:hypothetical protein
MVDFIKSFQKGLDAAKTAEENKEEIQSVFRELNEQLSNSSDGTLFIERQTLYVNNSFHDMNLVVTGQKRATHTVIYVKNPKVKHSDKTLAKWKINRNGYPCQIILDDEQMFCEDKAALENSFKELLRNSTVGDILYKVMNLDKTTSLDPDEDDVETVV